MQEEHMEHLPTPKELAELYMKNAESDPRSLYYKRKIVRPKFPVGRILLFFVLMAGFAVAGYFVGKYFFYGKAGALCTSFFCAIVVLCLLAKHILIAAVLGYQALAPTKIRMRCRYEPSCSQYMILAVKKYGFWRGMKKGLRRWKSCKPPNGGFDLP